MGYMDVYFCYHVEFSTKDREALVTLLKKYGVEYDERYILA